MRWVSNLEGKRSIENEMLGPGSEQDKSIEMEGWREGRERAAQYLDLVQGCRPEPPCLGP